MLHGLGAGPLELMRLAKEAHNEGFSVFLPSIDGYCFGTEPKTWGHWQQEVQEYYRECKRSYETVSVLGVSMGATLALLLAEKEHPNSIVLLSTALAYDGWAIPWYQFLLGISSWLPFAKRYKFLERDPYGVKNEETRSVIRRMMTTSHISESGAEILSYSHISEGMKLIEQVLSDILLVHSPALFIHAIDDESVHIRNPEFVYQEVKSSVKEFIYLGDSYHMITVDNERDIVHKESLRFLKKMVNRTMEIEVFEIPRIQSYELRRLMEQRT